MTRGTVRKEARRIIVPRTGTIVWEHPPCKTPGHLEARDLNKRAQDRFEVTNPTETCTEQPLRRIETDR